jgi:hypothetical protein
MLLRAHRPRAVAAVVMGRRPARLPGAAKRAKSSGSDQLSRSGNPDLPPPLLWPVVTRVRNDFKLTDDQISELERAGGVTFSENQRRSLQTLADSWLSDLCRRLSARPGAFRKRLDEIPDALTQALNAIRLNAESATELDRHLLHWILEQGADGALGALESKVDVALEMALKTVAALKDRLPKDPGKPRPYDDERRLKSLADMFEDAGGAASVYSDGHEGKIADTPFRRFAQAFYRLLPAHKKRTPGGLDDALRAVLTERRRSQTSP